MEYASTALAMLWGSQLYGDPQTTGDNNRGAGSHRHIIDHLILRCRGQHQPFSHCHFCSGWSPFLSGSPGGNFSRQGDFCQELLLQLQHSTFWGLTSITVPTHQLLWVSSASSSRSFHNSLWFGDHTLPHYQGLRPLFSPMPANQTSLSPVTHTL